MNDKDFAGLLDGIREMGQHRRGQTLPGTRETQVERPAPPEVKALRDKVGMSQNQFARTLGLSVSTLRNWEQGRTCPDGPARALLKLVEANPQEAMRVLSLP